jgi:hypothetical protein
MRATSIDSSFARKTTNWGLVSLVLIGTGVCLLPAVFGWSSPSRPAPTMILYGMLYIPAAIAAFCCYRFDRSDNQKQRLDAVLLCISLTLTSNYLHSWLVDENQYFPGLSNLEWQMNLHQSVLQLQPSIVPHSYRNLFVFLVFYVLYRYGRFFLEHEGSLFSLVLFALVVPVSYRFYAGQPVDPMSHLSFLLSFIFLETEQWVYLLLTLVVGSLAKETVLAMGGYYALCSCWKSRQQMLKATIIVFTALGSFFAVRALVLHGTPAYKQISGVRFHHITVNWGNQIHWVPQLFYTLGIFLPLLTLGWRVAPRSLRSLVLYLFPVLFISGLAFSYLREARNFVPLVAPFALMTVYYLCPQQRRDRLAQAC